MTDPIQVVAGLIYDANECVLLTQRSANREFPLRWESPGGKMEPGETPQEALIRELREEIDLAVLVEENYFEARLEPPEVANPCVVSFYLCRPRGVPRPVDVVGLGWFSIDEARHLNLVPANRLLFDAMPPNTGLFPGRAPRISTAFQTPPNPTLENLRKAVQQANAEMPVSEPLVDDKDLDLAPQRLLDDHEAGACYRDPIDGEVVRLLEHRGKESWHCVIVVESESGGERKGSETLRALSGRWQRVPDPVRVPKSTRENLEEALEFLQGPDRASARGRRIEQAYRDKYAAAFTAQIAQEKEESMQRIEQSYRDKVGDSGRLVAGARLDPWISDKAEAHVWAMQANTSYLVALISGMVGRHVDSSVFVHIEEAAAELDRRLPRNPRSRSGGQVYR